MGCRFSSNEKRAYSSHTRTCNGFEQELQRRARCTAVIMPAISSNIEASMEEGPDFGEFAQPVITGDVDIEMHEPPPVCSILL